jgi:hypothetical protein
MLTGHELLIISVYFVHEIISTLDPSSLVFALGKQKHSSAPQLDTEAKLFAS